MKLHEISPTELTKIREATEFAARSIEAELVEADREEISSVLLSEAMEALTRWYDPAKGARASTYVKSFLAKRKWRHVHRLLVKSSQLVPTEDLGEEEPCSRMTLARLIYEMDVNFALEHLDAPGRYTLRARLKNVVGEDIRTKLGLSPRCWRTFFTHWQRRVAWLLELEPSQAA